MTYDALHADALALAAKIEQRERKVERLIAATKALIYADSVSSPSPSMVRNEACEAVADLQAEES